jgi:uncharacterized phage protein (TIGR01671 family)
MREIKFRGLDIGGREWVYGDLIHYESGQAAIFSRQLSRYGYEATEISRRTLIKPDTIGQYTELKDMNNREVYEGDILRDIDTGQVTRVAYNAPSFILADNKRFFYWSFCVDAKEVIGNIHENPELLNTD